MKATLFAAAVVSMSIASLPVFSQVPHPTALSTSVIKEHHQININKADLGTLVQSFKGIGKKRAEAIIAFREAHGGFKSIDDLALVKGIGKSFVEKNRAKLSEAYSLK